MKKIKIKNNRRTKTKQDCYILFNHKNEILLFTSRVKKNKIK